jgi:hypothetical protein
LSARSAWLAAIKSGSIDQPSISPSSQSTSDTHVKGSK